MIRFLSPWIRRKLENISADNAAGPVLCGALAFCFVMSLCFLQRVFFGDVQRVMRKDSRYRPNAFFAVGLFFPKNSCAPMDRIVMCRSISSSNNGKRRVEYDEKLSIPHQYTIPHFRNGTSCFEIRCRINQYSSRDFELFFVMEKSHSNA